MQNIQQITNPRQSLYILALMLIATTSLPAQSLRDIEILIGKWTVEERHASGWWEKGERTCEWIMDSTYIQCETKARSSQGKERTYRFLINYNGQTGRFEMTGIYSNWPLKQHDAIRLDGTGMRWTLEEIAAVGETTERRATIIFTDRDNYSWTGRNLNRAKNTTTEYTEIGKRISP